MSLPSHGSNPAYLYEAYVLQMPEEIIDFSVNLNPFGPPLKLKEKWPSWFRLIEDYPDPQGKELINIISEMEDIDVPSILLGNGGAELITLIASHFSGKSIGIMQPAFSEYEKTALAYGCDITYIHLSDVNWGLDIEEISSQLEAVDALFLCHPNNPTGVSYSQTDLLDILKACEKHRCYLIVDEAFLDFLEEGQSLASFITESSYLIVVRSLTKMYSIAGLRLGFLMTNPHLLGKLKSLQPHWSVNALALEAGKTALKDKAYVRKTRQFIHGERKRIMHDLHKLGYQLSDSKLNFYLLRDPSLHNQSPLLQYLLKKGIVPRHTENYPGLDGWYLRFAIRQQSENNILLEALAKWKQES